MAQSFSYSVKSEIIENINQKQKAAICLLGILVYSKSFEYGNITFQTEHELVADFFVKTVTDILKNDKAVTVNKTVKKNDVVLYTLTIEKPSVRKAIFDYYKLDVNETDVYKFLPKNKFLPSFVSGAFLACGSVIDPNKEYHLEFVIQNEELCNLLSDVLLAFDITAKSMERKKTMVLYIKESEHIEDVLTLTNATKYSLEIMNVKILKDVRNKINRAVNCDNANIEKSLKAAERQIEAIELIDKTIGISALPDDLIEMANLRYNNPDFNLKELGNALNPPVSRSGANHRLERIEKIAEEIRAKNPNL